MSGEQTLPALVLQTFFLGCLSVQPWRMELRFSSGQKAVCLLIKGQAGLLLPAVKDQGPSAATQAAGGCTVHRDCSSSPVGLERREHL